MKLHPLRRLDAVLVRFSACVAALGVTFFPVGWPDCCGASVADDQTTGQVARRSLLAKGTYRPEGGLVVSEVARDSALRQISQANGKAGTFQVMPGDIITHVNGEPIFDEESCTRALGNGPNEALLTIIDHNTGRSERWVCRPALVQQSLSVGLRFRPEGGAEVQTISPGSPTLRMRPATGAGPDMRLVVGDVILRINGEAVDTEPAYLAALNREAGDVRLSVADRNTGAVSDWICSTVAIRLLKPVMTRRSAWILLVGQTDDPRLGRFIPMSLRKLQQVFTTQIAPDRLHLRIVDGPDCTADGILTSVRALPVAADDTLLVYYLGHGAFDPAAPADDPTGGHYFDLPAGRLSRRTLRREIEARPGRLKVLISDACNVQGVSDENIRPVYEYAFQSVEGLTATEKLLFNVRGIVDIEAASRGQYSWYGEPYGGWFTHTLAGLLPAHGNWPDLLACLKTDSNDFFHACKLRLAINPASADARTLDALRNQEDMTPVVFAADFHNDVADEDARDRTRRNIPEGVVRYVEVRPSQ